MKYEGLLPINNLTIITYININRNSPKRTVKEYNPNALKRSILGASTIIAAKRANTPYGAASIIRSIIFKITSLSESKNFFIGFDFFLGIKIIAIPKRMAKKIT